MSASQGEVHTILRSRVVDWSLGRMSLVGAAEDPNRLESGGVRIRLFDADRTDRVLTLDSALAARPTARQLLWVDLPGETDPEQIRALVGHFNLDVGTEQALASPSTQPHVELHGQHFHLRLAAEPDPKHPADADWLDVVAAPNVVITSHAKALTFLAAMDERIATDASIGELDSAEFVAAMLDAVVTTYHGAIDGIEDELDEVDSKALARQETTELFARLVGIRRRIGRLRRLLAAHRELFAVLGRPDFGRGIATVDPNVFLAVAARFEGAIQSLESTREVALGSFDILMTRTAQRTNDVMRVLTLATVLALPATLTAGFLGMNVIVPVPNQDPAAFWLILGAVVLFEVAALAIARWRGWI
ncbi:MAG: CorA family divalent cation transporter [Candidatus Limnocylindrales bacterium]